MALTNFLRVRSLTASERPSLSLQMMRVGAFLTLTFVSIAVLAPVLQGVGWLQSPLD